MHKYYFHCPFLASFAGVPGQSGDRERGVGAVARLGQPGEAGRRGRLPLRRGLFARGGHGHAAAGRRLQARAQGLGGPAGQVRVTK